tara:strand:+ start:334 stop:645 length:312 start_codon:yes stop_codon:yes gene_type:complete
MNKEELKEKVVDALKTVYDPEMPSVNILDLGLIYELNVTEESDVSIKHTLTTVFCPFADDICRSIEDAVKAIPEVNTVKRELVFDPPFSIDMVPEDTKLLMGL